MHHFFLRKRILILRSVIPSLHQLLLTYNKLCQHTKTRIVTKRQIESNKQLMGFRLLKILTELNDRKSPIKRQLESF